MFRSSLIARSVLALCVASSWLACNGNPASPSTPLVGVWGGDHVSLSVTDAGSHAEFDCAHGDTPTSLAVDVRHAFRVGGTFVREHGGPILLGEVPDSHPAVYFGTVTANTMVLTVELTDTGIVIGTFTLARDTPGRVVKCL
jgi:hypothetical protein